MKISCAFPPGADTVEHAALAESLGYDRVWLFDSPALYMDVWAVMALVAQRTSRVGLGTAVLIPNLRHPMTQAAAIATIDQLAPGRLAVALGTGFTGRLAMGQKPLTWAYVRRYVRQMRALLAGETVEIEGAMAQMIHPQGFAAGRPVRVPILIGANGPKGLEVARELGDGVMCLIAPQAGFDWCAVFTFGTVLDDGEDASSPRAIEAAGGGYAVYYHSWAVDALPQGAAWKQMMEQFPAETRHLKTHELHMIGVNDHDRPFIDPSMLSQVTFTGTREELGARLETMEQGGATEVLYQPMGPDVPRELRAFAEMASLARVR